MTASVASDDLIVFHYAPVEGRSGVRRVRPLRIVKGDSDPALVLHPAHWYLQGYDVDAPDTDAALRSYRLDRMWSASCPPGGRADAPTRKIGLSASDLWERLAVAGMAPPQPWQRQLMDELDRVNVLEKRKHEWSPLTQSGERFPEDFWEPARTAFSRPAPPSSSKP